MSTQEEIAKIQADVDMLTDRINDTQLTVGDGLSLLTRHLREKSQKLAELHTLLNHREVELDKHSPGMVEPDLKTLPEKL